MALRENIAELVKNNSTGITATHNSWERVELKHIAKVVNGYAFKSDKFNSDGYGAPLVRIRDVLKGYTSTYFSGDIPDGYWINKNDILIGMDGDFNVCRWDSKKALLNQRVCKIELTKPELFNSQFLFYTLPGYLKLINEHTSAITVKHLSSNTLCDLPIPLPPINEQVRIANKLNGLLSKVDAAQTRLEKIPILLKRFRQAVLTAAASGKLTREWREENTYSTTAMLSSFTTLKKPTRYNSRNTGFIQGVVATAVGKPDHKLVDSWEWVPLIDIATMGTGHTPSRAKSEYWGGDIYWIGIKDARNNHAGTIFETEQKINELGLANSAARILPRNTICISRTASIGYVVKMGKPMATSQDFVTWTPTKVLNPDWLKWLFVGEKESLFRYGKGTTHTTIYFPEWLSLHVALPPLEEQKEIVRRIEDLFALANKAERQYSKAKKRIDQLSQSLLAKAFRGELVTQAPSEEPAAELLKRIKSSPKAPKIIKPKRITKENDQFHLIGKSTYEINRFENTSFMKYLPIPEGYLLNLLTQIGNEAIAKDLWKKSELDIDDFYAQLKHEIQKNLIFDDNSSSDPTLRKLKAVAKKAKRK